MIRKLLRSGVFWMILSVVSGSVAQLFIKLSGPEVSTFLQIFFRFLIGGAVALFILLRQGVRPLLGEKPYRKYLMGRSVTGFLSLITYYLATRLGSMADVTIVNRAGPFFTSVFAVVFLKEKTKLPQWIALVIVFIGALIAANPTFSSDALPMLLAFLCAIFNGATYTLLAFCKDKVHSMSTMLYFSIVGCAMCLPFVLADLKPLPLREILILLAIGAAGSLTTVGVTMAFRLAPASEVSIYEQLSIVTSLVFGWIFLNQVPGVNTLVGGAIVITASVLIYFYNRRRHRAELTGNS